MATRFSKIYIDLGDYTDYKSNKTSLRLSLLAASKYNCMQENSTNRIEVWLGVKSQFCWCTDNPGDMVKQSLILADAANKECFGTVTTILLKVNNYECTKTCRQDLTNQYTWALLAKFPEYCDAFFEIYESFKPAFVVLEYSNIADLFKNVSQCKYQRKFKDQQFALWKKLDFSDTEEDRVQNMTRLVAIWKNWLHECNNCVLSQAFDSYCYNTRSWKTNGWWYLEKDSANATTATFEFIEKTTVAPLKVHNENPREFSWLKGNIKFIKSKIGIQYTGNMSFDVFANDYCRILINMRLIPTATQLRNSTGRFSSACKGISELVILYYPSMAYPTISDLHLKNILKADWNIITIMFPVRYNRYLNELSLVKSSIIEKFKNASIQYGYILNISMCNLISRYENPVPTRSSKQHSENNANTFEYKWEKTVGINFESSFSWKNKLLDILADPSCVMYVFSFDESKSTVNIGATRRFQQRSDMFETCQNMIINNRNHFTEIGFFMHAFHKAENYYSSAVYMQSYVKYVDLMTRWVENHTNTMIFIGPDKEQHSEYAQSAGWYIYDKKHYKFITSREEALRLSTFHYPSRDYGTFLESGFDVNKIVILATSLSILTLIFIVSTYLIRRRYKESYLNENDIQGFFTGEQNVENMSKFKPNNVPYNKERYEIPDGQFKLDLGTPLGSGEFGRVYKGTIFTKTDKVDVAIKTTNPQKPHKVFLTGLLSEIKVLAFVGKHENIVEWLGANTSKLNDGKIYIFLEMCHLGSLEKYLREMGCVLKASVIEEEQVKSNYVNVSIVTKNMLDNSLSEDLHRWSTDICRGMVYLAEKHVVHADLSTRNVLLSIRREAKICDFGLSRRMYNYADYVKTQNEPLPWKWMAPESLRNSHFNEKSDVWAYGVTLWKIYSLGATPYAGLSWSVDFVQMLENGLALSELEFIDENRISVSSIIGDCRKIFPDDRPKFSPIYALLNN